mgnify:CR=1 FL=1
MEALRKFLKFGSIGGAITFFGLIGYYICLEVYNFSVYPVYIILNLIAVVASYLLNSKFTFKKKRNFADSIKYQIIYIFGILFGLLLIYLLELYTPLQSFYIVVLIIPLRVAFTYVLVSKFVFSDQK